MKSHSSLVPPARFATFMAMVMLFSDTVSQSQAAVTVYSGFITVNDSDYPGDIALDDVFSYTMTVDDSITDSDPSTTDAFFTNAITGFTMARVSGSGAWNPSGVLACPPHLPLVITGRLLLTQTIQTLQAPGFLLWVAHHLRRSTWVFRRTQHPMTLAAARHLPMFMAVC